MKVGSRYFGSRYFDGVGFRGAFQCGNVERFTLRAFEDMELAELYAWRLILKWEKMCL